MGKRANTKVVAKSPQKKAKVDEAFVSVEQAVTEADQIPERVRVMLVNMLPFALKLASDERHELQSMAVDMVEQSLSGKKSALEATANTEESALVSLKASEETLVTGVATAESALAAQKDVAQAKKAALEQATNAERESEVNLLLKRSDHKEGQDKLAEMTKEKTAIESAFAEHFKPIEEGESKAHLKKLEPFLKRLEIESTLLTALPSTCGKTKDKRGSFDNLVLVELDKAFNVKIAALGDAIAGDGPQAAERAAAMQAAEDDFAAKKAAREQAAAEYKAAEKEQCDRESALSTAKQDVEDFQPKVDAATEHLSAAQITLANFEAGPFANFLTYKTRVAAVPVEEAPAEEAMAEAAPPAEVEPAAPAEAVAAGTEQ